MAESRPVRQPTPEKVVVPAPPDLGSLAEIGPVEEVDGADLAVVRVEPMEASARAAWERVLDSDAELPWAAPVLVDEEGHEQLPTGQVSVRFHNAPSDEELAAFAERHGLVLQGRNEYVPAQAVFTPADLRGTYLPELSERLAAAPEVAAAWITTLSQYRRV